MPQIPTEAPTAGASVPFPQLNFHPAVRALEKHVTKKSMKVKRFSTLLQVMKQRD